MWRARHSPLCVRHNKIRDLPRDNEAKRFCLSVCLRWQIRSGVNGGESDRGLVLALRLSI